MRACYLGALVLLALAFLTPMFYYIPDAALGAVIVMAVTDMISFTMVKHLWTVNSTSPDYYYYIIIIIIIFYYYYYIINFFYSCRLKINLLQLDMAVTQI